MTARKFSRGARRSILAFTRVLAVLVAVAAATSLFTIRAGANAAEGTLLELGRHLSAVSELGLGHDGRGVVLNGQVLGFRMLATDTEVSAVLDHFEAWCRGGPGAFRDSLEVLDGLSESRASSESWRDLTWRKEEAGTGFVACIRTGAGRPSQEMLFERIEDVTASGNLADLGRFHYVYVAPGQRRTQVVAVWTEGDFYPARLFPATGDAPGLDVPGVPRPPTGRRLLSAGEIGEPYALTSYVQGGDRLTELVDFYREHLPRNGWRVLADTELDSTAHSFAAERGERMVVVVAGLADGGESFVTIADASESP